MRNIVDFGKQTLVDQVTLHLVHCISIFKARPLPPPPQPLTPFQRPNNTWRHPPPPPVLSFCHHCHCRQHPLCWHDTAAHQANPIEASAGGGQAMPLGMLHLCQTPDLLQVVAVEGKGLSQHLAFGHYFPVAVGASCVHGTTCAHSGWPSAPSRGGGPVVTIFALLRALLWLLCGQANVIVPRYPHRQCIKTLGDLDCVSNAHTDTLSWIGSNVLQGSYGWLDTLFGMPGFGDRFSFPMSPGYVSLTVMGGLEYGVPEVNIMSIPELLTRTNGAARVWWIGVGYTVRAGLHMLSWMANSTLNVM